MASPVVLVSFYIRHIQAFNSIVFRRQGSHQVVLNTLLWPEMCYDKGSSKSLRLTAMDAETEKINVYLVTVSFSLFSRPLC